MKKVLLIIISLLCVNMMISAKVSLTVEENIRNISERVEKRYFNYDSFEVYPLYNLNDEVKYFLVEFEPTCFVLVEASDNYWQCNDSSRYTREEIGFWEKYVYVEKINPNTGRTELSIEYLPNENGEYVRYYDSPYKLANVLNEKKYLIKFRNRNSCLIPAVKRNGKFLNLVSMEEFDETDINEKEVMPGLKGSFIGDPIFWL